MEKNKNFEKEKHVTLTHLHLILNHFPIVGAFFGFFILLIGQFKKDHSIKKVAFGIFLLNAILILPVYFTGEPAEDLVKQLPGISESMIEEHEESAETALVFVEIAGGISLLGLFFFRKSHFYPKWFVMILGLISLLSIIFMVRSANLGGKIRHTEVRSDVQTPALN